MDYPRFNYTELYDLMVSDRHINCIKFIREEFGLGLRDAKILMDKVRDAYKSSVEMGMTYRVQELMQDFDAEIRQFISPSSKEEVFDDIDVIRDKVERLSLPVSTMEQIMILIDSAFNVGYDEGERTGFEQALMEDRDERPMSEPGDDYQPERVWEGAE